MLAMDEAVMRRDANVIGAMSILIGDAIQAATEVGGVERGPEAAALCMIAHMPGLGVEEIRIGVGLSHPGAVRLIDRLQGQGRVERRACARDGRRVALHLTPTGAAAAAAILDGRAAAIRATLSGLDDADRALLARLADKALRNAVATEAAALRTCRLCDESACSDCPVEAGQSAFDDAAGDGSAPITL